MVRLAALSTGIGGRVLHRIFMIGSLLLAAVPALAKAPCATPEELRAAQVRQLHYELQVAALNCRGDDPSMPGKWAAYVQRHGATMTDNAKVMRAYFTRTGKGAAGFDRHNTVVTNRESIRVHEVADYCEAHAPLFDRALRSGPHELAALAGETVGRPEDFTACTDAAKGDGAKATKKHKKTAKAE